jgi:hypothetical protein
MTSFKTQRGARSAVRRSGPLSVEVLEERTLMANKLDGLATTLDPRLRQMDSTVRPILSPASATMQILNQPSTKVTEQPDIVNRFGGPLEALQSLGDEKLVNDLAYHTSAVPTNSYVYMDTSSFSSADGFTVQPGAELPILDTWQGKVANDNKPELKTGFIGTEAQWKEVWAKVNPKDKLPEVDFTKYLLLVSMQDAADPNRSSAWITKDDQGMVTLLIIATDIGWLEASDQTIYRFYKVSSEGVIGVYSNGEASLVPPHAVVSPVQTVVSPVQAVTLPVQAPAGKTQTVTSVTESPPGVVHSSGSATLPARLGLRTGKGWNRKLGPLWEVPITDSQG